MLYLRAFISGITIPTIVLPVLVFVALFLNRSELLTVSFFHYIPVIWGVWNVLYFAIFRDVLPGPEWIKLLITGAMLGFIVAFIGVFIVNIPSIVGLSGKSAYFPFLGAPILYAILWLVGVKPLNKLVGITSG